MPSGKNSNPGKYPVPQYVVDWFKKNKGSKAKGPNWWPTPQLVKDICHEITQGKSALSTLNNNPDFPPESTFFKWIIAGNRALDNPDGNKHVHPDIVILARAWARAGAARLHHDIEEIREIERKLWEEPQRIASEKTDLKGRHYSVPNPKAMDVQAARTILESKRWRLSREMSERFGDKSKVEHSGSVKVERPADHMPEWMKAQLEAETAKTATDQAPQPVAPAKDGEPKTVH